jgi:O-antigen/teichoic acid export membrane protein
MFLVLKLLSHEFGVEGFGVISQAMGVGALFSVFAGGGNTNGIVREIAASTGMAERAKWLRAAFVVTAWSILALGVVSVVLYVSLSDQIFPSADFAWVFLLVGLCQVGTSIGNTSAAFLSSVGSVKEYSLAGIIGSIISSALIFWASKVWGFMGAVASTSIFALSPAIVSLAFVSFRHRSILTLSYSLQTEREKVRKLLSYSYVMIVAALAVPAALIFMRSNLSDRWGWTTVGLWQSVARIGDAYMQFFGVMLSNILLPRLSSASAGSRWRINRNFAGIVLSVFLIGGIMFYAFDGPILRIVYSEEFTSAAAYIAPQLVADFLKIVAALFVFQHLANGRPSVQAVGEVIQASTMLIVFIVLLPVGGMSAAWAYVAGVCATLLFLVVLEFGAKRASGF